MTSSSKIKYGRALKKPKFSNNETVFPWRQGNQLLFLIDGEQFYPAMLNAIQEAQHFVLMEMYLFESGRVADQFIDGFMNASLRGLSVQLLVDGYGGLGLSKTDRNRMIESGVQLVEYNPLRFKKVKKNLFRTHRKCLIIDGCRAFVGGAGITDSFDGHFNGKCAWRETVIDVKGQVVKDWQTLFTTNFKKWSNKPVPNVVDFTGIGGDIDARVAYTSGGRHLEIKKTLLNRVYKSRENVWLASAYFVPSRKIRKSLRKAALKGKDVRLLLPGPVTDHPAVRYASRRYYARLLRFGVRIFEYKDRFSHTKILFIDDWFSIGSSNMDRWNFRWNLEANQEIKNRLAARQVRQILQNDFAHSKEIVYHEWKKRSWVQHFKEWLWGKVDLFLSSRM